MEKEKLDKKCTCGFREKYIALLKKYIEAQKRYINTLDSTNKCIDGALKSFNNLNDSIDFLKKDV